MSYLIFNDFKQQIQADNLLNIINKDMSILDSAIIDAQEECKEYLSQKYVLDAELSDTDKYDITKTYTAANRVYLDADAYSDTSTYPLNALTLFEGNVYKCTTAILSGEPFNQAHWAKLGAQFNMFNIPLPKPLFNANKYYNIGDQVFWKGKVYTCAIKSSSIDHTILLQLVYYNNIPSLNVMPDDPIYGVQYWGVGIDYIVGAGLLPNDPWKLGDNRNRNLRRHMIAIVLFIVHNRIAPRNIPELRDIAYRGKEDDRINARDGLIYPEYCALGWLQGAQRGMRVVDLEYIQPRKGGRVRFGGQIRNQNGY